ncbi:MAG TPA: DNA translocase FtsK [Anaerolineales bacterium]|nr:DNA translocase FtsK [Anaerolineales bacterium]
MPDTALQPLRVFLCHASEDKPTVRELHQRLKTEDWIDAWLDEDRLLLGEDWDTKIQKELESADIVIVFISDASMKKTGYVQKELRLIYDISLYKPEDTIFVIPLRLEECQPPWRFRLWQWGDYFAEKKESTYQSLLRSLKERYLKKLQLESERRARRKVQAENAAKPKQVKKSKIDLETATFEHKPTEKPIIDLDQRSGETKDRAQPNAQEKSLEGGNPTIAGEEDTRPEVQINWQLPVVENILDKGRIPEVNEEFILSRARLIQETLASFDAPVQVVEINRGPSITQYGVEPLFVKAKSGRVKVRAAKIESLADEIAFALAVRNVRIQVPVPGHSYIGIEVPNEKLTPVALLDIIEGQRFQSEKNILKFVMGRDVIGRPIVAALEKMPHLLIAGVGGSGKSVCVDSILACLLLHNTPNNLRLMLIDMKRVDLNVYNGIPHLVVPVIVEVEQAVGALRWVSQEIDKRYHMFAEIGARNITDYNAHMEVANGKKMPFLVVVINEFANLMRTAPNEIEQIITRLAKIARNTGIHLILVTQWTSGDVLPGLIKINFPARIVFALTSETESRAILDQVGAELLLGRGDMLFQAPDALAPVRLQGTFISNHEIQNLLDFWSHQLEQDSPILETTSSTENIDAIVDPLLPEAIGLVRREKYASTSMLQRHMRIGYTRAARLVDMMEDKGIVGPPEGTSRIRKILDYGPTPPPKDV